MKKIILILTIILIVSGCQIQKTNEGEKEITTIDGNNQEKTILIKNNPNRLAVMDYSALDIIDSLNLGDNVVGVSKQNLNVDYLNKYINDEKLINLGTVKEPNMEAILEANPDLIIIGGRLASYYDELSKIAPVYLLKTDPTIGVINSIKENTKTIASLYGLEKQVEILFDDYTKRINKLNEQLNGKKAIIGMMSGQKYSILGNDGRCSLITDEIGFENVGIENNQEISTHGNEVSYEFILNKNPEYIFVLDRDQAIGSQSNVQQIIENELIKETIASKNNNVIILNNSNVWYMVDGGVQALGLMISDIENNIK